MCYTKHPFISSTCCETGKWRPGFNANQGKHDWACFYRNYFKWIIKQQLFDSTFLWSDNYHADLGGC